MEKNSVASKPLMYLKGMGEKRARIFSKPGIYTLGDLLHYYPRDYIDKSKLGKVITASLDTPVCIKAEIVSAITETRARSGIFIYKFLATDGETDFQVLLFNQKFKAKSLVRDKEYLFYGRLSHDLIGFTMSSPEITEAALEGDGGTIEPVYSLCAGLTQYMVRSAVQNALPYAPEIVKETLSEDLLKDFSLMPRLQAIKTIHSPKTMEEAEKARERLAFDELLEFSLKLSTLKQKKKKRNGYVIHPRKLGEITDKLPYELTNAQKNAVNEALSDMRSGMPMSRLLQGDVGSGKTAVAALLMYTVYLNGFQSCIMVPTEILAQQHFRSIQKMLGDRVNISLLTGSTTKKQKQEISAKLKDGEIDIVIGTHALLEDYVEFLNLAFVVTDEQHRFGVNQRKTLAGKGKSPHVLVMSATPIPRTLAIIIYGDLDITVMDELPGGRIPAVTLLRDDKSRDKVYSFLRKEISSGHQGYIVCPLVEESEELSLKSVNSYFDEIKHKYFKDIPIGKLYGSMKKDEKNRTMADFAEGKLKALLATTVIEVGMDVPNATVMIIENAERFGLSQLHQLRGRIGRSTLKSYCIMLSSAATERTRERLMTMVKTTNGFEISEQDLALRGPGDFFGSRQHGLPQFKIADLAGDSSILNKVKMAAEKLAIQKAKADFHTHSR